jgi:hypothetical protein
MGSTWCSHAFLQTTNTNTNTTVYTFFLSPRWASNPIFSSIHIPHFLLSLPPPLLQPQQTQPTPPKKKKKKKEPTCRISNLITPQQHNSTCTHKTIGKIKDNAFLHAHFGEFLLHVEKNKTYFYIFIKNEAFKKKAKVN